MSWHESWSSITAVDGLRLREVLSVCGLPATDASERFVRETLRRAGMTPEKKRGSRRISGWRPPEQP